MEVEIVEFYLTKQDPDTGDFTGTIHAYVTDIDMDIRGVQVVKKKNHTFVGLPIKYAVDKNGKKIQYPVISFTNSEKMAALKRNLIKAGKKYIEENVQKK